ncbi:hypothetical protein Mterra_01513 [Calidithermus terrae]|uniref:Uncharacterized protein n=1 Tax=Calidithermus terrae TaxID=1408545 RepID=A0A399EU75_9DEIN|nr:hypothetical protein [Calidithermus terrae]RIH86162.1 hypothetical protein Mterra_01513 [Calidithermus terrae]
MTFQEKKNLGFIAATVLVFAYFWFNVFPRHPASGAAAETVLRFWGSTVLIYVVTSIGVLILLHILTSITHTVLTREREPSFMDERDRLFDMKSDRYMYLTFIAVFLLAMLLATLGAAPAVTFKVLMTAFLMSQIVGSSTEFFLYRRGY